MERATAETLSQPEYTLEAFWSRYGEKSGLTEEHCEWMWQDAVERYTDEPPYYYHNFEHACEVLWETMRLADYAEENGVSVDRKLLIAAALFHDADYHQPTPSKHDSKEAYSAAIFNHMGLTYGYDTDERDAVSDIIMKTRLGNPPETLEQKIMVRADIANVGADYVREFLAKSRNFFRETSGLHPEVSWLGFAATSLKVLATYLSYDLSLGDFDRENGLSLFTRRALSNLYRFATETAHEHRQSTKAYLHSLGETVVNVVLNSRR
jgi:HD superfamily phosphodiesterase